MSKPLSRKYVEDYESDEGFVEDAPKSKKRKSEVKQTKEVSHGVQKDDEGNEFWEVRCFTAGVQWLASDDGLDLR